jgi:hypothetical protein
MWRQGFGSRPQPQRLTRRAATLINTAGTYSHTYLNCRPFGKACSLRRNAKARAPSTQFCRTEPRSIQPAVSTRQFP